MKLSKKAEYALRALTCLGAPGAPPVVSIQEIAGQANIPKKFLEQVLLALKKAGLVHSSRGKAGGYSLHTAPARVTLGDIIQAVDGPFAPLPCADGAGRLSGLCQSGALLAARGDDGGPTGGRGGLRAVYLGRSVSAGGRRPATRRSGPDV